MPLFTCTVTLNIEASTPDPTADSDLPSEEEVVSTVFQRLSEFTDLDPKAGLSRTSTANIHMTKVSCSDDQGYQD